LNLAAAKMQKDKDKISLPRSKIKIPAMIPPIEQICSAH
jgi:hypothetical protein